MLNLTEWAQKVGISRTTASKLYHRKLIYPEPIPESAEDAATHRGRPMLMIEDNAIRLYKKAGRKKGWRKYTVIEKTVNVLPW